MRAAQSVLYLDELVDAHIAKFVIFAELFINAIISRIISYWSCSCKNAQKNGEKLIN